MQTNDQDNLTMELCPNATDECRTFIRRAVDRDADIKDIQKDMLELKKALADANTQTKEIIEIYKGMKLLILILKGIGVFARWLAGIAVAVGIVVGLWQMGVLSVVDSASKHVGK